MVFTQRNVSGHVLDMESNSKKLTTQRNVINVNNIKSQFNAWIKFSPAIFVWYKILQGLFTLNSYFDTNTDLSQKMSWTIASHTHWSPSNFNTNTRRRNWITIFYCMTNEYRPMNYEISTYGSHWQNDLLVWIYRCVLIECEIKVNKVEEAKIVLFFFLVVSIVFKCVWPETNVKWTLVNLIIVNNHLLECRNYQIIRIRCVKRAR